MSRILSSVCLEVDSLVWNPWHDLVGHKRTMLNGNAAVDHDFEDFLSMLLDAELPASSNLNLHG